MPFSGVCARSSKKKGRINFYGYTNARESSAAKFSSRIQSANQKSAFDTDTDSGGNSCLIDKDNENESNVLASVIFRHLCTECDVGLTYERNSFFQL